MFALYCIALHPALMLSPSLQEGVSRDLVQPLAGDGGAGTTKSSVLEHVDVLHRAPLLNVNLRQTPGPASNGDGCGRPNPH